MKERGELLFYNLTLTFCPVNSTDESYVVSRKNCSTMIEGSYLYYKEQEYNSVFQFFWPTSLSSLRTHFYKVSLLYCVPKVGSLLETRIWSIVNLTWFQNENHLIILNKVKNTEWAVLLFLRNNFHKNSIIPTKVLIGYIVHQKLDSLLQIKIWSTANVTGFQTENNLITLNKMKAIQ